MIHSMSISTSKERIASVSSRHICVACVERRPIASPHVKYFCELDGILDRMIDSSATSRLDILWYACMYFELVPFESREPMTHKIVAPKHSDVYA